MAAQTTQTQIDLRRTRLPRLARVAVRRLLDRGLPLEKAIEIYNRVINRRREVATT